MGTFECRMRIRDMDLRDECEIDATVDTGAAYTTLPARLLRDLGVDPIGKRRFLPADGCRAGMGDGERRE